MKWLYDGDHFIVNLTNCKILRKTAFDGKNVATMSMLFLLIRLLFTRAKQE